MCFCPSGAFVRPSLPAPFIQCELPKLDTHTHTRTFCTQCELPQLDALIYTHTHSYTYTPVTQCELPKLDALISRKVRTIIRGLRLCHRYHLPLILTKEDAPNRFHFLKCMVRCVCVCERECV